MNYSTLITLTFLLIAALPMTSCAEKNNRNQGPPPEAIEACQDKSEGDVVSFSGRRGESVSATCQTIGDILVAVPEGHNKK